MAPSPIYTGTLLLTPLADLVGQPVDMVNCLVFQVLAVPLGFLLTSLMPQGSAMTSRRYGYCLALGLAMIWALIGWQTVVLLGQVLGSYVLLKLLPRDSQQTYVFIYSFGYLMAVYVWRITQPFEDVCFDVTYPMMVTTQKLTSLAFSISDWQLLNTCHLNTTLKTGDTSRTDMISSDRKKWAVRSVPGLLEFLSFSLAYQGALVGPFCHFRQYKAFIEGNNRDKTKEDNPILMEHIDGSPSRVSAVFYKAAWLVLWATMYAFVKPHFPDKRNVDPAFISGHRLPIRLMYVHSSQFFLRAKFYVTWCLADIVYNASGMGYCGRDELGRDDWTGMTNVNPLKVETSTSLKVYLDNWNIKTTHWLRHVSYDRVPRQRSLSTFVLSAMWHGLDLGYYITFIFVALCVDLARRIRHRLRPWFQTSALRRAVYACITWLATHLVIGYAVMAHVLLQWEPCIQFYSSMYWFIHITVAVLYVTVPSRKKTENKGAKAA